MYDERRTRPWKRSSETFFGRDGDGTSSADADACVETRLYSLYRPAYKMTSGAQAVKNSYRVYQQTSVACRPTVE